MRFLRCVHLPEQSSAILLFEAYDPAEVENVSADVLGGPAGADSPYEGDGPEAAAMRVIEDDGS